MLVTTCISVYIIDVVNYSNGYLNTARAFVDALICNCATVIFRLYDSDCNGKVSFNDVLEVLRDLSGSFLFDEKRENVLAQVLQEAGYTTESSLISDDFVKVLGSCGLKMQLEVPIDLVVFSWFDFPLVVPIEGEV
ncbi:uncharacterized protein [Pyrus communis]|uniref:uncharacterized protein n=1 Tax=Pyrus communis TaxID=23211 RepID=UPI0035BF96E9